MAHSDTRQARGQQLREAGALELVTIPHHPRVRPAPGPEPPLHLAVRHEAQADLAMLHRRVERPASGTQQPARLRQASRRGEVLPRSAGALLASRTR